MTDVDDRGSLVEEARAWVEAAMRSGCTRVDERGISWEWLDDVPAVLSWPSLLQVANHLDVLAVPISGGTTIIRYAHTDRVTTSHQVLVPWESMGRLIESVPVAGEILAKALNTTR